jgi:ABC-2 type transport system ATP-binding protein
MKIVSGLLSPDSGEVYVDGIDAIKNSLNLVDDPTCGIAVEE